VQKGIGETLDLKVFRVHKEILVL
jgi:hypothetical protein